MPHIDLNHYLLSTASADKWRRIGTKRRAGVLVPLFSVYSEDSLGIGELVDIKLLVDFCSLTGNSIIQFLPMNEVGAGFCPYDSISSFALEPMYIALRFWQGAGNKSVQKKIKNLKLHFPAGSSNIDYALKKEKLALLWDIFLEQKSVESSAFKGFIEENVYWLLDFALYKVLKNYHGGKPWYEWQDSYKSRQDDALRNFRKTHNKEVTFEMWIQWQLYEQFQDVREYAVSKKVLIKGDLPILVSKDSSDVWAHREFFKLEFAAGAPPDMYCAKGQRWGMPTYNWKNIANDGYRYLKEKLKYAENFYDILRIDHVVGFFRIWSIPVNEPLENHGLHGFFDPHDEFLWKEHGSNILSIIINNTKMLLSAEDLGIIPKVCTDTLRELGIPGNDVQRWVKDWNVRHDFLLPEEFRELSVAMLSTHDTPNWPAWWENEAGTVDEDLFIRKCNERGIDYPYVKDKLFDTALSNRGRLRWLNSIGSIETLVHILGKRREDIGDFIDMYKNTYHEKEKLWRHLKLHGQMREKCDEEIIYTALKITLSSKAIFCIETIVDLLYLDGVFKGDPYQYRINTPGTVGPKNWFLTIPISLEELLEFKANQEIKELVVSSGR